MTGSDFAGAKLDGFTIVQGDWSYTNLRLARLDRQDLRGARFFEADLSETSLQKADLRGADLTRCILDKAKLKGADLRDAVLDGVNFKALDVEQVRMDREQAVLFMRSYGAKVD